MTLLQLAVNYPLMSMIKVLQKALQLIMGIFLFKDFRTPRAPPFPPFKMEQKSNSLESVL